MLYLEQNKIISVLNGEIKSPKSLEKVIVN